MQRRDDSGSSGEGSSRPRIALVLGGGGARGAYEAGVLRYLAHDLERETGARARFDIVCGTSVGALHACFVAAAIDDLDAQTERLLERWTELLPEHLLHVQPLEALRLAWSLVGGGRPAPLTLPTHEGDHRGGLIDGGALERFILGTIDFARIAPNIDARRLRALSVTTTRVADGGTTTFIDSADPLPKWSRDPYARPIAARIGPSHALASAAIPLLFPAVAIDGAFHVDGGLRQNTPLSPAIRLGADRVVVITLRTSPKIEAPDSIEGAARQEALPSPFFLAGKTLNALLIDRIDVDLDRMGQANALIAAGRAAYGEGFVETLNAARRGLALREVRAAVVRPTVDLGAIAAQLATDPSFRARSHGVAGRVLHRLAEADDRDEADLLSYVLFDGEYAARLIALGRADARAHRDELAAIFAP